MAGRPEVDIDNLDPDTEIDWGDDNDDKKDSTTQPSPQANQAWAFTEAVYPDADSTKLDSFYEEMRNPDPNSTKKLRMMIKMRHAGKKAYPLFTRDRVTGKEIINPDLPKEIVKALGPEAEKQIAEIKQLKKEAKERRDAAERQVKINTKTQQQQAKDREELQRFEMKRNKQTSVYKIWNRKTRHK